MEYPPHLLPQAGYNLLVFNDYLHTSYLIRHTPDKDLFDPETGRLKLTYIVPQSDHLRDFSTNLLGIFTIPDTAICMQGTRGVYFNELWEEGEQVEVPTFPEDFSRKDERGYFFLLIGDLHGQILPFQIGDGPIQHATCRLTHTPTRCNFWHMSVRWFNAGQNIDSTKIAY